MAPGLLTGDFVPGVPGVSVSGEFVAAAGCIAFSDSATQSTTPALWPRGTTIDSAPRMMVQLENGTVDVDVPLTILAVRIQAKELWRETEGVAECAADPEQSVIVVTGLDDILMQQ